MPEAPQFRRMLAGFLLMAAIFAAILFVAGNEELFLYLNARWTPVLGQPARIFSLSGESWAMGALLLLSLRMPFRITLLTGITWLSGALHSWLFKLWLCKGWPRPFEFYQQKAQLLNLVEGVKVHHWNTFPSGHTLTAVSAALLLPYFFPKLKTGQVAAGLLIALLCGLSRILLVQHWPQDVLGGLLLGCSAAFLAIKLTGRLPEKPGWRNPLFYTSATNLVFRACPHPACGGIRSGCSLQVLAHCGLSAAILHAEMSKKT